MISSWILVDQFCSCQGLSLAVRATGGLDAGREAQRPFVPPPPPLYLRELQREPCYA